MSTVEKNTKPQKCNLLRAVLQCKVALFSAVDWENAKRTRTHGVSPFDSIINSATENNFYYSHGVDHDHKERRFAVAQWEYLYSLEPGRCCLGEISSCLQVHHKTSFFSAASPSHRITLVTSHDTHTEGEKSFAPKNHLINYLHFTPIKFGLMRWNALLFASPNTSMCSDFTRNFSFV